MYFYTLNFLGKFNSHSPKMMKMMKSGHHVLHHPDLKIDFQSNIYSSVSDPYHWPGSGFGSVSGNVDLDPGTKKKS